MKKWPIHAAPYPGIRASGIKYQRPASDEEDGTGQGDRRADEVKQTRWRAAVFSHVVWPEFSE